MTIFTDNGATHGRRTRLFRDAQGGGVEWIFAVDHAGGCARWYGFGAIPGLRDVAHLKAKGMKLERFKAYRTELTPAGEQCVIPGCELDHPATGKRQLDLF